MNRSPEYSPAELAAEEKLQADGRPAGAELAADWQLRQELRGLATRPLPDAMRRRILGATHRPARPAWWMGMAAAVLLSVAVVLALKPTGLDPQPPTVSDAEMQELNIALAALAFSARRTSVITGRELAASMTMPALNLDDVPYARQYRRWIQPKSQPKTEPTKEQAP